MPSQWETSSQSNAISHWLGTNLESALIIGVKFVVQVRRPSVTLLDDVSRSLMAVVVLSPNKALWLVEINSHYSSWWGCFVTNTPMSGFLESKTLENGCFLLHWLGRVHITFSQQQTLSPHFKTNTFCLTLKWIYNFHKTFLAKLPYWS